MKSKVPKQRTAAPSGNERSSQKTLDKIRELLHRQDDMEDVQAIVDSGILENELPFGHVPESCIAEIAARKSVLERQEGYSWQEAAILALQDWSRSEMEQLYDLLGAPDTGSTLEKE